MTNERYTRSKHEVTESSELDAELQELPGFQNLSVDQQRLIKLSLYTQQRRERASIGDATQYRRTKEHVWNLYCTAAVAVIEDPTLLSTLRMEGRIPAHALEHISFWDNIDYNYSAKGLGLYKFKHAVAAMSFPLILDLQSGTTKGVHTALLLGFNKKGQLMVWEKQGMALPYRVVPIETIAQDYADRECKWGIRSIKTPVGHNNS